MDTKKKKIGMLISLSLITCVIMIIAFWQYKRKTQIVWGICSLSDDSFSEEWQKGFNTLLHEKGVQANVKFEVKSLGWGSADWESDTYQRYGEKFEEKANGCDIITDCGQLGYYCSYSNFIKEGVYEELTPYFETEIGQQLLQSYPDVFWEAVSYNGGIYGIPSQRNISFTDYYVFEKKVLETYGLNIEGKTEWELIAMAEDVCRENPMEQLRSIAFRDIYAPEGYEALPGGMPFIVNQRNGEVALENKLDNRKYINELRYLNNCYLKGIWSSEIDLERHPYFFAIPVSSYSPQAAVRLLCSEYGWNPENYIAVEIGKRPFRLTGNTTGIHSNSQKKEIAFQILSLAFADQEVANYIAYGIQGEHYQIEDGVVHQEKSTTKYGTVDPLSLTNHLLLYPVGYDDPDKDKILSNYYEMLPKSVLIGKWIDYEDMLEEVQSVSQLYETEEEFFWGLSMDFDAEYEKLQEVFTQLNVNELREKITRQLNTQQ